MGARGKKPTNVCAMELTVKKRPEPPKKLPKIAKVLWKEIVNSKPADHFQKSELPLLAKYCMAEHIYWTAYELMNERLVITTEKGYELPDTYLNIMNTQFKLQTAAGTKLRINTNSRISNEKAAHEKEPPQRTTKGNTVWDK